MKSSKPIHIASALILLCHLSSCHKKETAIRPNIIYFLADDLGYGEVGVYGQEIIQTPHIDALAQSGMRFTDHYSGAPVCAPARCILMTGKHAGHAYIRGNDEWTERGDVWNYELASQDPKLEGQRPIPRTTQTLSKKLQTNGYTCGVFGKWGLGAPYSEGAPNEQGFDYFYGYNCQRQAHNLYPPFLWENDQRVQLDNELIVPHTKLDNEADPHDPNSYAQFTQVDYAPDIIHEKALDFISNNADEPFFLYYASPLPHLPLQAPEDEVNKYRQIIGEEVPYIGDDNYFPCLYPRATYAAMISILDQQLGELVNELKAKGIYENTIIIFSSDNGPTYCGGVDYNYFRSSGKFSNGYGRTKGFVYEGGIRVPLIISWPEHIRPKTESAHPSTFYDMFLTICDLAGIEHDLEQDGISMYPTLFSLPQSKHDYLYWEFPEYNGQQALRMDNWKAIRKNIHDGNLDIELYDLSTDPKEQINLALQHPKVVAQIVDIMNKEHQTSQNKQFQLKALGD